MNRQFEIAKLLLENPGYYRLEDLEARFQVSTRTIREDLNDLQSFFQEYGIEIVRSRRFGVKLDEKALSPEERQNILGRLKKSSYLSPNDRMNAMICYLLLKDSRFTIRMLSDYLGVGKNTIVRDLEKCERWFGDQGIAFRKNKKAGTVLVYEEYSYRKAILNYAVRFLKQADFQKLYQGFEGKVFLAFDMYTNDFINHFTKGQNLLIVKNFIRKYESDFMIHFSDESFMKIFFYLCVTVARIRQGRSLQKLDCSDQYMDTKNIEWMQANRKLLEEGLKIRLGMEEAMGILFTILSQNKLFVEESQGFEHIGDSEIVSQFVEEVKEILCVEIGNREELVQNLSMHMKPAVNRMRYGIVEKNVLTEEIKQTYPLVFDACGQAAQIYERRFSIQFSDDEIAYLAMHIASSLEQNRGESDYFHKVLIVCSSGIGTSSMVKSRLLTEFPNVLVQGIYSVRDLHSVNKKEVELIISTVALYGAYDQPVVYVSPLLTGNDIERIGRYVGHSRNLEMKNPSDHWVEDIMFIISQECNIENYTRLQNKLKRLFYEKRNTRARRPLSFFLRDQTVVVETCESWEDAVFQAGSLLVREGKASSDYVARLMDSVTSREVSVVLGKGVAMPHAGYRPEDVYETGLAILKLNRPVAFPFSEEDVWLIIVLAADPSNSHIDAVHEIAGLLTGELLENLRSAESETELLALIKKQEEQNYA